MIRLGLRVPVLCLLGVSVAACSAAGDEPSTRNDTGSPDLDLGAIDQGSGSRAGSSWVDDDANDGDTDSMGGRGTAGTGTGGKGPGSCDCDDLIPGITIEHGDDGIKIAVELPNLGIVVVETKDGDCTTSDTGIHVNGDVTIDLGSGTDIPLLNADLDIEGGKNGGLPDITGSADVVGSVLGELSGSELAEGPLHVSVDLDTDIEIPGGNGIALDLAVTVPAITIPAGALPVMANAMALADVDLVLATDGCHRVMKLWGSVDTSATIWAANIPVSLLGKVDATVAITNDQLLKVELDASAGIAGGSLWCGLTPLLSVAIPKAHIVMDDAGLEMNGKTTASLHPSFSVDGNAQVTAKFSEKDWSINVCAAVMLDLSVVGAKATTCLDLTKGGPKSCQN